MNSNETVETVTEHEVRTGADADFFPDEGDAQEWAVWMTKQGHTPTIHRRTKVITVVEGAWEQIPAVTPEAAAADVPEWARDQFGILDGQFPVAAEKAGDSE